MCPHNKILEERKKKNIPKHNKDQDMQCYRQHYTEKKWATLPPKYRTVQILIG